MGRLRIHHAYVGIVLIAWSTAVVGSRVLMIGEYIPWLAWGGLLFGTALVAHDIWSHLARRKRR